MGEIGTIVLEIMSHLSLDKQGSRARRYSLVDAEGQRVLPRGTMTLSVGGHQPTQHSTEASGGAECASATVSVR